MRANRRRDFQEALARAAKDASEPQPTCAGHSDVYVDYDELPSAETAKALCAPCPLLALCHNSATAERPVWGIRGGRVWVDRRQAPKNRGKAA